MPAAFLEELQIDQQLARHQRIFQSGAADIVAENEAGQLLGFASFGPSRFKELPSDVELYTLYVDHLFHRQGIGQLLLNGVLHRLPSDSRSLGVLVMAPNPYRVFYERNGFERIGLQPMELAAFSIDNIVYKKKLR